MHPADRRPARRTTLDDAVDALDAVARRSANVPRSSLSGDVILAQVQSTVVDLYQVTGLDLNQSLARMPPPALPPPDAA
jgi:hypothetical protein